MKVQFCSDLHLEFSANRNWLENHSLIPKADILLIAGDTYYLNRSYHKLKFIKELSTNFKQVYIIPGNHEYYEGFDLTTALQPMEIEVLPNVHIVNNKSITIDGVSFIFSTLWSKIERETETIKRGMVDFRRIKFNKQPLQINHYNQVHEAAFAFVKNAINAHADKKVIVTHHLPSSLCVTEEFKDSKLSEAFCVDLTTFIEKSNINHWIYGHSHRNQADFRIKNTQLVTNQFGYVDWNEQFDFDYGKVIDLSK